MVNEAVVIQDKVMVDDTIFADDLASAKVSRNNPLLDEEMLLCTVSELESEMLTDLKRDHEMMNVSPNENFEEKTVERKRIAPNFIRPLN